MNKQNYELDFTEQDIYTGIDVPKKRSVIIMSNFLEHKVFSQDLRPIILVNYLRKHFPGAIYNNSFEAGFCRFLIH